jgi:GT2 family glycosyltransferase
MIQSSSPPQCVDEELMSKSVRLTVFVVNYNTANLLRPMMDRLVQAASAPEVGPLKAVIVDNASRDHSLDVIRALMPTVKFIANTTNVGFGRANNQCLALMEGQYALLLNTDAFVSEDTLIKTLEYMDSHPQCGVLGARLIGQDGALQPSCRYFPTLLNTFIANSGLGRLFPWVRAVDDMNWDHRSTRECDWVPGCYYLVRRAVIDQVGLFDPRYFLYFEEVDHCRAVKAAGWSVVFFHDTEVVHIGGESAKSDAELTAGSRQISALQIESELLYFRKHAGFLGCTAHLLLSSIAFVLASAKALLRSRRRNSIKHGMRHLSAMWRLAHQTRWGTCPTR